MVWYCVVWGAKVSFLKLVHQKCILDSRSGVSTSCRTQHSPKMNCCHTTAHKTNTSAVLSLSGRRLAVAAELHFTYCSNVDNHCRYTHHPSPHHGRIHTYARPFGFQSTSCTVVLRIATSRLLFDPSCQDHVAHSTPRKTIPATIDHYNT